MGDVIPAVSALTFWGLGLPLLVSQGEPSLPSWILIPGGLTAGQPSLGPLSQMENRRKLRECRYQWRHDKQFMRKNRTKTLPLTSLPSPSFRDLSTSPGSRGLPRLRAHAHIPPAFVSTDLDEWQLKEALMNNPL